MVGNEYNFGVICPDYNDLLLEFLQSIDTSNLVNGKPVYYFVNQSNIMVNPDAYPEVGYLGFVNCVNVTVQGMNLTNNGQGLLLAFTNESEITGNNASNNYYGFYLYSTFNCTFSGNDVTASDEFGIELDFSSNNTIYHNDFINNTSQVYSSDSTNVWDNGSVGNYWSDYLTKYPNATQIDNSGVWNTPYVIDANNTDYYPLMQPWVPYEGGTITINADGSITPSTAPIYSSDNITYTLTGNITITNISNPNGIVVDRDNIVLDGAGYTVTGSGASNGFLLSVGNGITLDNMSNVTINNMMITNFTNGIYLHYSSNNTLSGNNLTNNYNGVNLELSSSNTLSGNNITANNESGIVLGYSDNNLLSSNNVTTNDIGVYLETSSGNTLSGNNITANNDSGVWLDFSSNNFIFRNNFMNNTIQVTTNGLANIWDNGSTGNYWSDYLTKYPSATETNGIWNTPYVIDSNNTDYYPLAVPMMETVVPEFPSFLILPLFLIATLLAVIIYKKKGRENKPKLDKT
jgi:parallel beta-helix repeat protein